MANTNRFAYVEKNVCQMWPPNKSRVQWIGERKHVVSSSLSMCWFWRCKWLEVVLRLMWIWLKCSNVIMNSLTTKNMVQNTSNFPLEHTPRQTLSQQCVQWVLSFRWLGNAPCYAACVTVSKAFKDLFVQIIQSFNQYNPKDSSANCSPSLTPNLSKNHPIPIYSKYL